MTEGRKLKVSLVATVLNEYGSLPAWLAGIEGGTRLPDECVIVDGGSNDGSWELLSGWDPEFRLVLKRIPGASISEGRNAALAEATGDVVAVTDAGTVADTEWLARLEDTFVESEDVDVASGFFRPFDRSVWSWTLGAATLPDRDEIDERRFLPSSRSVAFRRSWFSLGLRYPEWLDYCEDLVFDLQLRRAGAKFVFVPEAQVMFEPRGSWSAFFRQYFRYARGDGKAGLFARRHVIRYMTYGIAAIVLARRQLYEVAALAALGAIYAARPARRLFRRSQGRGAGSKLLALPLIPIHLAVGDVAKMIGYPVGLIWRVRRWGITAPGRVGWWCVRPDGARWRP